MPRAESIRKFFIFNEYNRNDNVDDRGNSRRANVSSSRVRKADKIFSSCASSVLFFSLLSVGSEKIRGREYCGGGKAEYDRDYANLCTSPSERT